MWTNPGCGAGGKVYDNARVAACAGVEEDCEGGSQGVMHGTSL